MEGDEKVYRKRLGTGEKEVRIGKECSEKGRGGEHLGYNEVEGECD